MIARITGSISIVVVDGTHGLTPRSENVDFSTVTATIVTMMTIVVIRSYVVAQIGAFLKVAPDAPRTRTVVLVMCAAVRMVSVLRAVWESLVAATLTAVEHLNVVMVISVFTG